MTAFWELKPGDKFTLDEDEYLPPVGVCVTRPTFAYNHTVGFLWWKKTTTFLTARCIQIHPFQGAVDWPCEYPHDYPVRIIVD